MFVSKRRKSNASSQDDHRHPSRVTIDKFVTEKATDTAAKIAYKARRTIHWDDLEHWQRDNHLIHTGYRPASRSFMVSFHSLEYVHNETVNIYTHLLPAISSVPCGLYLYKAISARYDSATHGDVLVFSCFFAGASFCLGMSSMYHTISNHSPAVARIGNAMDYIGIVGLITGSFIPSVYYGFYCVSRFKKIYWTMILLIGAGCTVISIMPRFRTPPWRPFRAGMFVSMGLSAVFPVLHGVSIFGVELMLKQIGLFWLVLQGALYIIGAAVYAAQVPERWYPGGFDILGSSHQIFHVLVVLAAISHLTGLLQAFDYRHSGLALSCL
ncbi:hemolysin-III family protein [Histoplasma capsulatum var. duboisii H88]|uniref:Hemolysin-III family protein n=1 Tax=Ajellomyces capsulatus (strain H88) TaxID=544711 RepID=F0U8P2_AJEC8|nr:hemolysin-III family protein [Histoplasma capsulatum var. duboisii H88]QSS52617.1 hemolysin-III family protein [Histoplasma capsulatum var. duboisii H88]